MWFCLKIRIRYPLNPLVNFHYLSWTNNLDHCYTRSTTDVSHPGRSDPKGLWQRDEEETGEGLSHWEHHRFLFLALKLLLPSPKEDSWKMNAMNKSCFVFLVGGRGRKETQTSVTVQMTSNFHPIFSILVLCSNLLLYFSTWSLHSTCNPTLTWT